MAKLREAAKGQNRGRWDESFKEQLMQIVSKATTTRLWDDLKEIRQHWIEFVSETKGKTGYGEMCLNWDPVTETVIDGGCPCCEAGMKPTTYYYAFAINRRAQQKTGTITVQPLRLTGKLAGKIGKLAEIKYPDMGDDAHDATDQKHGFDVLISQTNTNGKIEYEAHAGEVTPLTKAEREAFEEYVEECNIGKLAKSAIRPRAELIQSLAQRGVSGFKSESKGGSGGGKKRNYEDYDQAPDDDAAAPPKRGSAEKPKQKVEKRASLTGDDDDDEPRAKRRPSALDDDEDDEGSGTHKRNYAAADDDDVPEDDEE